MRFIYSSQKNPTFRLGFTLLELLTVVSITAVVASVAISSYGSGSNQRTLAEDSATRVTLSKLTQALRGFYADMGHFPNEGPLESSHLDLSGLNYLTEGNAIPGISDRPQWSENAGNLWQLFYQPIDASDPERWDWDRYRKQGWQGPYFSGGARLTYTDPISNFMRLQAVPDSFKQNDSLWRIDDTNPFVEGEPSPEKTAYKVGSPILFEMETDSHSKIYNLRSIGPDGIYDTADDIKIEVLRTTL